jgi:hypothetical protein
VLQVNNEFVENVTLEMADALVDEWNRELSAQETEPKTEDLAPARGTASGGGGMPITDRT